MKKQHLKKIAILIPAHNEKRVIEATLASIPADILVQDVYIVDDCSSDGTAEIARTYTKNVLNLATNQGKAGALNAAIKHFKLAKKYDYILPMDADTVIDADFLKEATKLFKGKVNNKVVAVCGKVVGRTTNWITSFRLWEYEISQNIHKNAQSKEKAISVCPGCATLYKADIFNKVSFPTGTMTEDMDLTFLIHRKKLGQIKYCNKAKVYTQDPKTIKDLVKQLDRWYTGFWQCVTKHNFPWGGQVVDFEVALLATEALLNGVLLLSVLFFIPIALVVKPEAIFVPLVLDLVLFTLPTIVWTAFRYRAWKLLLIFPAFYLLRILSNLIFFKSFFKTVLGIDFRGVGWIHVRRYKIKEEEWAL